MTKNHQIIYVVWNNYASFLNMQLQMKEMYIVPRITKRTKLLSIFGVNSNGIDTTELQAARAAMNRLAKRTGEAGKGTGTIKTGGKQNDPPSNDDEDECDDSGGWVDDQGVSSEDQDDDENKGKRKEQTHILEASLTKKNNALITLNEEWETTRTLLRTSKPDKRQKSLPRLDFARWLPNFSGPWTKVSRLTKKRPHVSVRGLGLIEWTAWEWWWSDIDSHSFNRVMGYLAAAAIAESSKIVSYRHRMILCNPYGGAATVRIRAQEAVATTLIPKHPGQRVQLHMPTLEEFISSCRSGDVFTEGHDSPTGCVTWADGIYPIVPSGGLAKHNIEIEVQRIQREYALGSQKREVQRIVDAVQEMRVAWHDPTKQAHARDNPRLDNDVNSALRALVDVSASGLYTMVRAHGPQGNERQCIQTARDADTHALFQSRVSNESHGASANHHPRQHRFHI